MPYKFTGDRQQRNSISSVYQILYIAICLATQIILDIILRAKKTLDYYI